jgi:hypothetical protein
MARKLLPSITLIGLAVLGVLLSVTVWLAIQQSRHARILILNKDGEPFQDHSRRGLG